MAKNVTGHIREKKGLLYAVVDYYNQEGERKQKWYSTKLPARGNKKKAEAILRKLIDEFTDVTKVNMDWYQPTEKKVVVDNTGNFEIINKENKVPTEDIENLTLEEIPKEQIPNMLFADYLIKFVPLTKERNKKIAETTYAGYLDNVKKPIAPYFREKGMTLKELTADDIQEFYKVQLKRKKPNGEYIKENTVIHYHAIIRLALCYARRMGYISENPIEMVIKPSKNKFTAGFYSVNELNKLIEITRDTKLELPVIFGGFYGMRRAEVVGLKWSAIDFENNVFYIRHTVTVVTTDGKKEIIAKDSTKTDASERAYPLSIVLKARLLEIKEKQEQYKKKFKRSYNKKWLDYVLVDELGELILPDYITSAFPLFLEKNNMRRIRFHDLRHTCASLLLNKGKFKGVDLKDIQAWLGHSDFTTTANIYSHLDSSSKANSLSALEGIINIPCVAGTF